MKKIINTLVNHKPAMALILFGSILLSFTMIKSGWKYDFGLGFWGANGHDGVWHVALADTLKKGNQQMPIFAGERIQNYHLGFDYLLASLGRLTFIPVNTLYFQVLPPIIAIFLGVLTHKFVLDWTGSKPKAWGSTFFVYFGGSFGWIVNFFRNGNLDGESMFWSQQSVSTLINPPLALSLILILAGLIFLQKGNNDKKYYFLASLMFGLTGFVKVYAGVLVLAGLLVAAVWQQLSRKGIGTFKVFTGAFILNIILVLPVLSLGQSSLEFKPFWFLETMMALSDRLGWEKFYSAMTNYLLGGNFIKLIPAYLVALGIFLMGNFGTRIISLIYFWRYRKILNSVDIFVGSLVSVGVVLPMLFVQSGTPWNTVQFMYYSLFFGGIIAGMVLGRSFERGGVYYLFSIFVILFTIPTTFASLYYHYLPERPPAMLPKAELEALEYLRRQPEGIVLTYPFDSEAAQLAINHPPRPLYLYESTAYVAAYSGKTVFLEDEVNLNITGYDWPDRRMEVEDWLNTLDQEQAYNFLRETNIKYIYWVGGQRATLGEEQLGIEKIYENDLVNIYLVK